ncbi:probable ADP-ribosylation factor GTPase-activating protein AGD14 isoform X2 [Olea europaea var. sylvestris]|uniref:probable ADP-ribosylation factor GTPase-activating protein AGD14 isoform X2 n=1 Tax=Olea europaea var. sylvestris TaxID=158386 RepID=UPI000C1D8764|nr:probable ADP-ribosylation factor GTPase-activating protein AGD14 isoform X2 [Olea europaea var. sylvestris]
MPQRVNEEERIERIIRDLLKLPENRRCINCNSLGPQYVCTTFWTFVCTNCSGVHREFAHRVKSVSMAKFSVAEVNALQAGGNERARQIYFKVWDPQRNSCPDASNLHRIRDFIKHVYVDRKYTEENSLLPMVRTKPKCDTYEKHSFERAGNVGGDDIYERQSLEKFSPIVMNNEKTFRYFMEQRSPRYNQENMRSGSHNRGRSSTRFEIVDDRYRDDGGVRRFDRYSSKESRTGKMSPNSQMIRETNSPAIRPVKDILGEKVLPLRIGEPPKANDGRDIDGSARDRKAADSTNPNSENEKPKENKTVDSSSLIDFDANPVVPSKAEPEVQQTASSAPSPAAEKIFNAPNGNSLEFLLFELSAPVALPVDSTPQISTSADALSGAPVSLPDSSDAMDAGSTTSIPKVSKVIGPPPPSTIEKDQTLLSNRTNSSGEVANVQKLPNDQEKLPSASPKYSHSNTLQSTSVETLYDQQDNITSATNGRGPVPNTPSEEPSQASSKPTKDTGLGDASKSIGRKELPVDLFTFNHMASASAVPSWQVRVPHGMGYGMQFYPAAMSMDPSTNSAKPRNPFDLGDEQPQIQAAMFPAMESLHGALPNMAPLVGLQPHPSSPYASALASQVSPYGVHIPPGAYTGQQLLHNPQLTRPQEISPKFGSGEDAFASLNPVQKSKGRDSSPAPPFPSTGGNPFG